jgi:hypothetical protein
MRANTNLFVERDDHRAIDAALDTPPYLKLSDRAYLHIDLSPEEAMEYLQVLSDKALAVKAMIAAKAAEAKR